MNYDDLKRVSDQLNSLPPHRAMQAVMNDEIARELGLKVIEDLGEGIVLVRLPVTKKP